MPLSLYNAEVNIPRVTWNPEHLPCTGASPRGWQSDRPFRWCHIGSEEIPRAPRFDMMCPFLFSRNKRAPFSAECPSGRMGCPGGLQGTDPGAASAIAGHSGPENHTHLAQVYHSLSSNHTSRICGHLHLFFQFPAQPPHCLSSQGPGLELPAGPFDF